ncbi:MAG TPA: 16S rRNA (adenine(1518)-N(6)/adenine(1519)-N(6))-dimethyltransferase RsmA [Actinomycetota bacterium]|nr:16S rRNA (adenine(1518)-N(6)/adenine(1519)-N(6))-dimethyltransferase RsmA [Actinomycetota bacterium]
MGGGRPSIAGPRLTPASLRALAARHGVRPKKSLGQHFLIEPALAKRIVEIAEVGPDDRVLEVGAGLGSLTVALAQTAGEVVAVELDRALLPALREVVEGLPRVRVVAEDAVRVDWAHLLGPGSWKMVANLPYNVAVPVVMRALEDEPRIASLLVMVQREVGERLVAASGDEQYGAVSVRVAYRAEGRVVRRVPKTVFWPEPKIESVLVSLVRRPPPVTVDESALWRVVDEAFAQRRKTVANALVRLGVERPEAESILRHCGLVMTVRAEQLDLAAFACVADRWAAVTARP